MKFPSYKSYRQPDADWLDELPAHWNVSRTKTMFALQKSKVGKAATEHTLLSLTLGGVIVRDMEEGGKLPAEFDAYQIVEPDDLVFCLFDIDEPPRTIGISHNHGMITGAYSVYRALPSCIPEYACYYFLHIDSFKGLRPFYTGLRKVVRADTFSKVEMPAPPVEEQKQIAAFLDYETAKIDTLIEKQQQLIVLLGEKRQAVISHAVTKGLNPDAPMRDSGIEWLGEVPEHWTLSKVGHQTQIYRGKFTHRPRNEPRFYDGQYPFIQTGDVSKSSKYITDYTQTLNKKGFLISREFPKGTLCMVITGAKTGSVAILDFVACFPDSIVGFYPKHSDKGAEYLFYAFQALKQYFDSVAVVSTQENLNVERISGAQWAWPPPNEQIEIARYLADMLERMKDVEKKSSDLVELLQERRTALISAAVTGKIDVRGWKPPSSSAKCDTEMEVA